MKAPQDGLALEPTLASNPAREVDATPRGSTSADPAALAGALVEARPEGAAWLDGGASSGSVLGLDPDLTLHDDEGDGFALLDALDEDLARARAGTIERTPTWIGWLTYDVGARWVAGAVAPRGDLPGVVLRRYPAVLRIDPARHAGTPPSWNALGDPDAARTLNELAACAAPRAPGAWPMGPLTATIPAHEHRARVEAAKRFIAAGDTYQVNLSQRFIAPWLAGGCSDRTSLMQRALDLYAQVRSCADAPMGALIHVRDDAWFVSNSPETLLDLRVDARTGEVRVASHPIKGTRPRGVDSPSDAAACAALSSSEKELAEHVMIVDLVRNDLGRIAVPGSVRAPARPAIVTLPTVHHLVSEVSCSLRPGTSLRELFEASFPGGSITGAPKRRTIELIATLEAEPRGIYCGAILHADATGVRASIPIRTAVARCHGVELRSGGGIVADSDPEAERQETLVKTRAFSRGQAG